MKVVGELFASGEMQLPFVLQSAETMKAAVKHLEPHMEKADDAGKGRLVLATVKGDVHDIGKNLVDIILTNNGYEVHNLGIKISITEMIEKAKAVSADAIGMSGLLVKSTLIMRDNLEELNAQGLAEIPVMLGGAALTRSYVERDLREIYEGRLFYGKDAFEGLHVMDRIGESRRTGEELGDWGLVPSESKVPSRIKERFASGDKPPVDLPERSPEVAEDNPVFEPPFLGLAGRQGHRHRRHRRPTSTRRRCSATSGSSGPRTVRTTPPSRSGSGRPSASSWRWPRPRTCSYPRSRTGSTRPTRTATTSSSGRTRPGPASWPASASPARASSRSSASATSSGPSTPVRPTTPPSTW